MTKQVHKAMLDSTPYMLGDSAQDSTRKSTFKLFSDKFAAIASGERFPFTLQLRDPLANSFIGLSRDAATLAEDPRLTVRPVYNRANDWIFFLSRQPTKKNTHTHMQLPRFLRFFFVMM